MISWLIDYFKGIRGCSYCSTKFNYKEREKKFEEDGIDSESDLDLLVYCSNECSRKDALAQVLIDKIDYELKKCGFVTIETKLEVEEFKKHG